MKEVENQLNEIELLRLEVKQLKEERLSMLISIGVPLVLLLNYLASILISKLLNIYKVPISYFEEMTWEWFFFLLFFVIEIFIVDDLYRKYSGYKDVE